MFRLQTQHIEVLTEFMEAHPDLAKGRLSVSNARDQFKALWLDLANKLNSVGMGERTVEKWQKTWSDYKGNLKKKAAGFRRYQEGTGGGPPSQKSLTELELRILEVLGTIFYAGVGVEERGLEVRTENDDVSNIEPVSPKPSTSGTSGISMVQNKPDNSEEKKRKATELDHDYLFFKKDESPKKRKKKDPMSAYEETITCLKSIENTIKVGFEQLNCSIKESFQLLAKAIEAKNT